MKLYSALFGLFALASQNGNGCEPSSDDRQRDQQERILREGTSAVGMPAIKNFREKRLAKMLFELRDQEDLATYSYLWSDYSGKLVFLCNSIGYGLPYATQFTNPMKREIGYALVLPQADPNGLFSPSSAEGTWVMCKDPKGSDVKPVYVEQRLVVAPFALTTAPIEK